MKDETNVSWRKGFAGVLVRRHRFDCRPKRIARRDERDRFAFFVVPIIWLMALLSAAGFLFASLHYLVAGEANWSLYLLTGVPLVSALCLLLFRWLRGHYNAMLDEP